MTKSVFLGIFLLATLIGTAQAKMYRWVDDDGNVVYSQSPPPDEREVQSIKPPPPPAEPKSSREKLDQQKQKLEDIKEDRSLAGEKMRKEQKKSDARKRNCEAAKKNLQQYTNSPANARFINSEGQVMRFTPEEREKRIQKAKERIEKNCD